MNAWKTLPGWQRKDFKIPVGKKFVSYSDDCHLQDKHL